MSYQILSQKKTKQIISRIAVEILENNSEEKEIILVGIHQEGYHVAREILEEFTKLTIKEKPAIKLAGLTINKSNPGDGSISLDLDRSYLADKPLVIVDDVLNTSRTLAFGLQFLLQSNTKRVEIAVLVNRSHTNFPISATYSGYNLATTLDDHIEVRTNEGVFLT